MPLAIRNFLTAHRVYDPTAGGFDPAIQARRPFWSSFTQPQPATVKVASMPSLADAVARWLFVDPIDDPSLLNDATYNTRHFTPEGNVLGTGSPIRFPRYVYVMGRPTAAVVNALEAGYSALASLGVRLVIGTEVDSPLIHSQASMVPVAGGSATPDGYITLTDETDDYPGGDLFVAMIPRLVETAGSTSDQNYALIFLDGATPTNYTQIETSGSFGLYISKSLAAYDAALAAPHIARYRNFQQSYYVPDGQVSFGSPPVTFTTTYNGLLAQVNPAGHPQTTFTTDALLAAQILTDATAFFS